MATYSSVLAWRIPMDRGAWRATVHRVAQSRTRLKWLGTHTHLAAPGVSMPTLAPVMLSSTVSCIPFSPQSRQLWDCGVSEPWAFKGIQAAFGAIHLAWSWEDGRQDRKEGKWGCVGKTGYERMVISQVSGESLGQAAKWESLASCRKEFKS